MTDDLDDYIEMRRGDPRFTAALAAVEAAFTEPQARPEEACDEVLHVGPTGVWRCTRKRATESQPFHPGPCHCKGSVHGDA